MKSSNANRLEPTSSNLLKPTNVDLLKEEVEKTFGRKILFSADCIYLQTHILKHLQFTLSFNTLRRFFGLMESKHRQSVYTLDVLSNYCGYSSFNHFVASKQQSQPASTEHQNFPLTNYLVRIFKNIELKNTNDLVYLELVGQTIQFLEHQSYNFDEFQREIARTKNGQRIYFEKFIHIDKLNSYYGDGLRYYLHECNEKDSQIFGHSTLCFRYWLSKNNIGVEHHYNKIIDYAVDKSTPSNIAGSFFAAQLFYANTFNRPQDPILMEARQYYSLIKSSKENLALVYQFLKQFSEALVLTSQYEEATYYIEEAIKKRKNQNTDNDLGMFEAIHLFKAFVKTHLQEPDAKELVTSIDPNNYYFLHKQYMTILYLSLKQSFQKSSHNYDQMQNLIEETGFFRLSFEP